MQTAGNRFSAKSMQCLPRGEVRASSVDFLEQTFHQCKLTHLHQSQFTPNKISFLLYFTSPIFALQRCCLQSPVVKNSRSHLTEAVVCLLLNAKCLWSSGRTAHYYRSFALLSVSAINFNTQFSAGQTNNNKKEREQFSFLCCVGNSPRTRPLELVGKRKERSFKPFQS